MQKVGTPEKKRWNISNREMWHDEQLWKEETRSLGWNNNKNYGMRILHQFKLMTNNGFGILLILIEMIKSDIAQTWEGIDGTTGGIGNNEWNNTVAKEEESWTNHHKNWKWTYQRHNSPGRIGKTNEYTWGDLDTSERRDHELIREYLTMHR